MNTQNILRGTPAQIEEITGIPQATLSILLRMAEANGQAKIVGTVKKNEGARGKPSNIWEVSKEIQIKLAV